MRRIIRRRELVADDAHYAGEQAGPDTRLVLPAAQFIAALGAGDAITGGAAIQIGPTDEVEALAPHLALLNLIVVDFPKIGEGRGFSQARMLRPLKPADRKTLLALMTQLVDLNNEASRVPLRAEDALEHFKKSS